MAEAKCFQTENLCQICTHQLGKYVCPKCNILYCSLTCYKSQSHIQCSETFYRDCVVSELSLEGQDSESKKKIVDILRKVQQTHDFESSDESESLDSDDEQDTRNLDLAARLEDISLEDTDKVWSTLTPKEKEEFQSMIKTGNITDVLPSWEPWWLYRKPRKLVTDVEDNLEVSQYEEQCPILNVYIPELKNITKSVPSPSLPYMLLHILLCYTFVARWLRGVHNDLVVEAATTLYKLCIIFNSNTPISNFSDALDQFQSNFKHCTWIKIKNEDVDLALHDVRQIVAGPEDSRPCFYIESALGDMYTLFDNACDLSKIAETSSKYTFVKDVPTKKKLQLVKKKLLFYLSWTRSEYSYEHLRHLRTSLNQFSL